MAGSATAALIMTQSSNSTAQDFSLLSMTELRERPGEILDRVADEGKGFIIERNGKRKACLVPLSVFFPDISPARIGDEIAELSKNGEAPRTSITNERELVFRFPHKLADGKDVELEITLPHGYPSSCPRANVKGLEGNPPHRWSDGTLCLYGVTSAWNPGRDSIHSTLQLMRRWLAGYETWAQKGEWPKSEV